MSSLVTIEFALGVVLNGPYMDIAIKIGRIIRIAIQQKRKERSKTTVCSRANNVVSNSVDYIWRITYIFTCCGLLSKHNSKIKSILEVYANCVIIKLH